VDEAMTTTTRNIRDNRIMADLYSEDGQITTGKTHWLTWQPPTTTHFATISLAKVEFVMTLLQKGIKAD
jgi:hypothetical protein